MKKLIFYFLLCSVAYPTLWITKAFMKSLTWCWDDAAKKESTNYKHQKAIWECRRVVSEITSTLQRSKP